MEPNDKMGFPPGVAEQMVYSFFHKYQAQHQQRHPPKPETKKRWEAYNKAQKEAKESAEKSKVQESQGATVEEIVDEPLKKEEAKKSQS
jgi:hypothetical protein